MLQQQPVRVNCLPRHGWGDHPADGALHIDASAGRMLLLSLDRKWEAEGRNAFLLKQPIAILWNAAQRRGYREAAVSWNAKGAS